MAQTRFPLHEFFSVLNTIPFFRDISLASVLKSLEFFSDLSPHVLEEIVGAFSLEQYSAGDVVCRHGSFQDHFYLILSGRARVFIPTAADSRYELYTLSAGDFFGEEIVMSQHPRENTVLADDNLLLLAMDRDSLRHILEESEAIRMFMDRVYIDRKLSTDLRRVPIFTKLRDDLFTQVLNRMELLSEKENRIIFRQGDAGDSFYLIRSGEVNVHMNRNGSDRLIAILGEGQFFGEMALFMEEPRNATIITSRKTDLVRLSRNDFLSIVEQDDAMMREVAAVMQERWKNHENVLRNPNMALINRKFLDLNRDINRHLDIMSQCTIDTSEGAALLATVPGSRYPYVYPRDSACASRFLYCLSTGELKAGEIAFRLLGEIARFIRHCQRPDGYWGQRYGIGGEDKGIYRQEDNVAHGVTILCRYLLAAAKRGVEIPDIDSYLDSIARGTEFARRNYYRNEIHLFYSTTSIHESAIEEGYSIWVNYAYLLMLRLLERVGREYGVLGRFPEEMRLKNGFEATLEKIFALSGRYVRRIRPDGVVDLRPDITLLSPFFFGTGIEDPFFNDNEIFTASIRFIEDNLWDPDLGMLQRYLPFIEDPNTHIHAGNGPWMQYTAMLAQYYFYTGNMARGKEIMAIMDRYRSREGFLCEHLTTPERFYEFYRLEWTSGRDFDKEFEPAILVQGITYNHIVEELTHMKRSYENVEAQCKAAGPGGFITFASPLMWSHAEYAMALILRTEREVEELGRRDSARGGGFFVDSGNKK